MDRVSELCAFSRGWVWRACTRSDGGSVDPLAHTHTHTLVLSEREATMVRARMVHTRRERGRKRKGEGRERNDMSHAIPRREVKQLSRTSKVRSVAPRGGSPHRRSQVRARPTCPGLPPRPGPPLRVRGCFETRLSPGPPSARLRHPRRRRRSTTHRRRTLRGTARARGCVPRGLRW